MLRPSPRSIAQALMEWPPLISIYEGPLWRRSLVATALTRISFGREYALIAAAAELSSATRLLDLACGPGIYARRFAREMRGGLVCGLDLSMPMLRYASRRVRAEGLENVVLIRGSALELPFEESRFDVVNCCGALHLLPDPARALHEVRRVLAPRGRVTIAAFRRRDGAVVETRARIRKRLYGIESFSIASLTSLLERSGFVHVRRLHAAGVWLIMSAETPVVPVAGRA